METPLSTLAKTGLPQDSGGLIALLDSLFPEVEVTDELLRDPVILARKIGERHVVKTLLSLQQKEH